VAQLPTFTLELGNHLRSVRLHHNAQNIAQPGARQRPDRTGRGGRGCWAAARPPPGWSPESRSGWGRANRADWIACRVPAGSPDGPAQIVYRRCFEIGSVVVTC
jgi:hypothetical protein